MGDTNQLYIYKRFERFWHWSQASLIMFLAWTGFEVHGTFSFFGFEKAVSFHRMAAYLLMGLIGMAVFWHLTTGEWKHYIPSFKNLRDQIAYYTRGIFHGAPHPFRKAALRKLNPLQVFVYLGFKLILIPVTVISGLLYMYQKFFDANGFVTISTPDLGSIAVIHTLGAFGLMAFLIGHVYMTTTGHTPTSNIRAMITGFEEIPEEEDHP